MKKIFTLCATLLLVVSMNAQQANCEDFESLIVGDPIAQTSPSWNTWGELMTGTVAPFIDDAMISSNQASSGNNSLFLPDNGAAGPEDVVLMFDPTPNITQATLSSLLTPYVSGDFTFSQMMYVRGGTGAYFNFQAENTPGVSWALEVAFDINGDILMSNTGGTSFTAQFPFDVWFEIKFDIDLSNNNWEVLIDGVSFGSFTNTINQIASLDIYTRAGDEFYIDDVCYVYTPFIALAYDMKAIDLDMVSNVALTNAPFTISGDIVSLGTTIINSLDINYSINGAAPIVDNLSGLNLILLDTLYFNHTITWNPPSTGGYLVEIWASNLNGNADMDPSNDMLSDSVHVWNALAVKQPLIETFTSSTCGPCNPANVTAEALFAQNPGKITSIKYQADWPGSGDPYYTEEVGYRIDYYAINSVPRMEIDGGWDQNGNNITQQIVDDYVNELCLINLSSTYSISGQTVDVDITVNPLENFNSNNLVVHSAVIEETTYNNIKNNGETQFEHVVKKMIPSDNGTPINSLVAGQQVSLNLQHIFKGNYRLPSDASNPINHTIEHSVEDFSNLMVAVWIQDVITKKVHQSTYATITSPSAFEDNNKAIQLIYPNPASDKIYISNLKEDNTLIKIYDINGRLVLENKISNNEYLNISKLSKGIYQIKFEGSDLNEVRKLIKN